MIVKSMAGKMCLALISLVLILAMSTQCWAAGLTFGREKLKGPQEGQALCPPDQLKCGTACVDVRTDSFNCGLCGNVCPKGVNATAVGCTNGVCSYTCASGWAHCNASFRNGCETNLMADKSNCGTCGTVCPSGQTCSNGKCVGPVAAGTRINLQVEDKMCSPCGTICATGQTCIYINGKCIFSCQ